MSIISNFNESERDRWVAKQAALIPCGSKVLDVGCGGGRYRSFFTHCDYKTQDFGQEPSTIGKYPALDYECDIADIPVPNSSFDGILCTEVLEHVPEPHRAIQEMARILRTGGKLFLTAPLGSFLHQEPYHFYGGYTPYWYQKVLPEASFEVMSIEANRGFFSWFGQEAKRFNALIDPRRTLSTGWRYPGLVFLWLITLPFCRLLFPILGKVLDRLKLEREATVGYHVVAKKK